jgi:hypothetical protein
MQEKMLFFFIILIIYSQIIIVNKFNKFYYSYIPNVV